jgi:hypothetical protein
MASADVAVRRIEPAIVSPAIEERAPEAPPPVAAMRAATLSTLDGSVITHGIAELRGTSDAWSATLGHLDRPGILVSAYFAHGIRDVVLSLNDGRRARARVIGTSFATAGERTCELAGVEPLAHAAAA